MGADWKGNWPQARQHFLGWWKQDGLVLNTGAVPRPEGGRAAAADPPRGRSVRERYTDIPWRVDAVFASMARSTFPADTPAIARLDIGPGSLALMLGSEPGFSEETVWFHPYDGEETDPRKRAPLIFDPDNRWYRIHERTVELSVERAGSCFYSGCQDLVENIDILAALRGPERLLMDMIDYPEWVERKVAEINRAWFAVYERIYDIIKDPEDGSACFGAFQLWGPGKTAKVQCDACAMFSPGMFDRFVLPSLTEQCEWLDSSMYHLDGHQCLPHLDSLLSIRALGAVEWTPDPQVPPGGDPAWYGLYRRILGAGKSVQAVGVRPDQVVPLLDAVGGKGMYIMTSVRDLDEAEQLERSVEAYR